MGIHLCTYFIRKEVLLNGFSAKKKINLKCALDRIRILRMTQPCLTNSSSQNDLGKTHPDSPSATKSASLSTLPCPFWLMKPRSCQIKPSPPQSTISSNKLSWPACIPRCCIPPVISGLYRVLLYFFSWNALKENPYPAFHPADPAFQWRIKWFMSSLLSLKHRGTCLTHISNCGHP